MRKKLATFLVWVIAVATFMLLFSGTQAGRRNPPPLPERTLDYLKTQASSGQVATVVADGVGITVHDAGGETYRVRGSIDGELSEELDRHDIYVQFVPPEAEQDWTSSLAVWVPILLLVLALLFFMRRNNAGASILTLRRAPMRELPKERLVSFAEVGGCEEAKELLSDVVNFLKDSRRWKQAGARLPRGVLLEGPPGCGKTLLARAVAGETNAKFYFISASEFVELFVGVGAARVRDLFETARKTAPSVIFIDELDAVGRRRGSGVGGSHDEREQTLNQLLVSMDGFSSLDQTVVIAATNRADILDRALLRAGRFDRRIKVPALDVQARQAILAIHTKQKSLHPDVSLAELAGRTNGFNGAELENLCNEAALLAVRRATQANAAGDAALQITAADFERALKPLMHHAQKFDQVDLVLIESASQLSEPTGAANVELTLKGGACLRGKILWADAAFIKIQLESEIRLVPKAQVLTVKTLEGTESINREAVQGDPWAVRPPGLA